VTISARFDRVAYEQIVGSIAARRRLSAFDLDVLALVAEGLSTDEIAKRSTLARSMVLSSIQRLKVSLSARTRTDLALIGLERGLLPARAAARQTELLHDGERRVREREEVIVSLYEPACPSPRQLQLLALIAAGFNNREIAERLHISVKGAGVRVRELRMRLNARTRAELVVIGLERGLLTLGSDLR
jgi:DNA-binding NarL/FixJ family response regulator